MRLVLDVDRCSSLGMCEAVAPDHVEIGDDGALHVLRPDAPESDRALLRSAVAVCPTGALRLQD